ncbi:stage II sporulation protein M [Actinomycetospora chibensis]|uniref:Stage II sporulation protein M n=1 Tax=Actinomycetospora chibensis TaxID=663606 RepID=A0ABV9RJL2_9PSEU|nr:stage II sporulation protein M [Actinomycetospora chibensis]MDD7925677.1 stage II sporulation protein M [Actinomycetospora chibensis]
MDVDAYVAAHRPDWDRLAALLDRRRWTGDEVDEAVALYERTATHLSVVRSTSPDPALVARLSTLVARARTAITGSSGPAWRDLTRFATVGFAVALASSWRWWLTTLAVSSVVMVAVGVWVARSPDVQAALLPPEETRRLVEEDFASYYSSDPASSFAARVWTNNAWLAAVCLITGVLILPVLWVLLQNVVNVGLSGGILAANGRADLFFGLITPHGLLELTALFVAAGAGLRLGWSWIDPGPSTRSESLARQGRTTAGMALGVTVLLLISGVIEAFVTPSGLPTAARIGIGVLAEAGFAAYVLWGVVLVRRHGPSAPALADLAADRRGHTLPT